MMSVVIAYADRMPSDALCSQHGYVACGEDDLYRGRYFRSLLEYSVQSCLEAGVSEVIVVNYNNPFSEHLHVAGARVLNVARNGSFSEWDAKYVGIEAAHSEVVITANADIVCSRHVLDLCWNYLASHRQDIYQGTKGWLNQEQTARLLKDNLLDCCLHEVVFANIDDNDVAVDGVEPVSWAQRSVAAAIHLERYGIDIWKNAGDFQAFRKDILREVEYPCGSSGWGGGDTELRLRAQAAGLKEYWEREAFVWHLFHPVKEWRIMSAECNSNFAQWGRKVDWTEGGFTGYTAAIRPDARERAAVGTFCAAYRR